MMNMNNLAQTHEILTPQLATKVGLTKFEFYKYVKANEYEQVGHGVYAAKDTWIDELEMLHRRCPMGVFSHDEAFYYYGLTDREPLVHTLTIYSGYNVHRLKEDGYKVYTVKKELLDVGKQIVKSNQGNEIPMYDLERTICDLVRSRSSIEVQDFNAVLKAYVGRKDKDLNKLMKYAKLFRVDKIIRNYISHLQGYHKEKPPEMDGFNYSRYSPRPEGGSLGYSSRSKLSNGPLRPERWSLVYSTFSSTPLSISFLACAEGSAE